MTAPQSPPPCAFVLFGAAGDLAKRLVVPALYNLTRTGLLPERFALVGVDRADTTVEDWRNGLRAFLDETIARGGEFAADAIDEEVWNRLAGRMSYLRGDLTDAGTYRHLGERLNALDREHGLDGNRLFYLAVASRFFAAVVDGLGGAGLVEQEEGGGRRRVVIEKPFGHDLRSARDLNARVLRTLTEDQIFRIDHFLGKETVQNIMALRFANGIFEPLWNRDRIDHVQITVAETVGVERRGAFYEGTGALRDMVPNHLFQLLAMIAMEPPSSFGADAVRGEKTDALEALRPIRPEDAVRGQYAAGTVLGRPVSAYREAPDVASDSGIETFAAFKLSIENWRWAGVPFYLRTGKAMTRRTTEIAICFKKAPYTLFRDTPVEALTPNWLVLQLQPDEGISLQFEAKRPGPTVSLDDVRMEFRYKDWFRQEPNVGYETLIYDCLTGDATLFQRADTVEAGWRAVAAVLDAWAAAPPGDFPNYAAGAAGPAAADDLLTRDGRAWRPIV